MSRVLRELMGAKEPAYSLRLRQLEQSCGTPKIDIAIAAGITTHTRNKIAQLGLDPADVTDEELYQAVMLQARHIDEALVRRFDTLTALLEQGIATMYQPTTVPVLKASVLKKIFKQHPPKQVMKKLHYSSIESFIKRADIDQVAVGIFLYESVTWHRRLVSLLKKCSARDYTLQPLRFLVLDERLKPAERHYVGSYARLLGCICIDYQKSDRMLYIATQALFALRTYEIESVLTRSKFYEPTFTDYFIKSLYHPTPAIGLLATTTIQWPILHEAISLDPELVAACEEPFDESDYRIEHIGRLTSAITETAQWFDETERLGAKAVSFHINDVAIDLQYALPLHRSSYAYRATALEQYVLARYALQGLPQSTIRRYIGVYENNERQ